MIIITLLKNDLSSLKQCEAANSTPEVQRRNLVHFAFRAPSAFACIRFHRLQTPLKRGTESLQFMSGLPARLQPLRTHNRSHERH